MSLSSRPIEAHSTDSALFRVKNDILSSIDDNKSVVLLMMLDLSAESDTVDHQILLQRLLNRFGIVTFHFGLSVVHIVPSRKKTQFVSIVSERSASCLLTCGVSQDSLLGLLLHTMYKAPLGDIMRHQGVSSINMLTTHKCTACAFKTSDVGDLQ